MNLRELPVFPTIVVLIAAGIMVALGIWQLGRAEEKTALIAQYAELGADEEAVELSPSIGENWQEALRFRAVSVDCSEVSDIRSAAGTRQGGAKGWALIARCTPANMAPVEAKIGWSRDPNPPAWQGGTVVGILDQNGRIVAAPPLAGLDPLARPDPGDLPNNHLAYAGQWFFFALTALVIYWFAIQKRQTERAHKGTKARHKGEV